MKPTLIKFGADVSLFCHPWLGHVRAMCRRMLVGAEAFPLAAEMMGDLKQRKIDPVPGSLCSDSQTFVCRLSADYSSHTV